MEKENNKPKKWTTAKVIAVLGVVALVIFIIIGLSAIYVLQAFGHILGGTAESIFPLREE
jgi:uncharacterized membrane protein YuzA (DUF378 family)